MQKKPLNKKGFGTIGALIVIIVLALVTGLGIYVYHKDNKVKVATTSTSQTGPNSKTPKSTTQPSLYTGWKSYCDATYKYCFKFPTDWALTTTATATNPGTTGVVNLMDTSKTVQITYSNAFTHDSGAVAFTPTYVSNLTSANESLTLVGGYSPAGGLVGNYLPSYRVVDSSFLSSYPLTVGTEAQFPNNPGFTDQATGGASYQGAFESKPIASINTIADAKAWLDSSSAKTSLQILQSLYYQK